MSTISPLFSSTCKVLRDVTVQELRTQNNFLKKELEKNKDILLHCDVIIMNHTDYGTEYKKTEGIYIGKSGNQRCNILVKINNEQYIIKQIFMEKIIILCSKKGYNEFKKNHN